jgi:hypothetical protein
MIPKSRNGRGREGILGRGRGNIGNGGANTGRRGNEVARGVADAYVVIPREMWIRLFVNEVVMENGRERSGDAEVVGKVPSRVREDKRHISAVHGSGR